MIQPEVIKRRNLILLNYLFGFSVQEKTGIEKIMRLDEEKNKHFLNLKTGNYFIFYNKNNALDYDLELVEEDFDWISKTLSDIYIENIK